MVGQQGETYDDVDAYLKHLEDQLPGPYRAGRDYRQYVELLREVAAGDKVADAAAHELPALSRVGGVCPCSRAVRWVAGDDAPAGNGAERSGSAALGD